MGDERPSTTEPHTPRMSEAEVAMIEAWHERAYHELRERTETHVDYLGLELAVPPDVFPPTPMSDLFGQLVLDQVRSGDRVLDMGTGSGSNALLAARVAHDVTAVEWDAKWLPGIAGFGPAARPPQRCLALSS